MTDIITIIINYRNFKYHYHYRYFQNTDSRPIVDSHPKIMYSVNLSIYKVNYQPFLIGLPFFLHDQEMYIGLIMIQSILVMSNQYQSQFQSYCNWIQHTSNTISHNLAKSIAIRIANGKVSGITNYIANSIPNGIPNCIVNDIANAIANVIAKP